MTLDQWLHTIEEHGLPLVALIVIIIWLKPKIDELWQRSFPKQPSLKVEKLFKINQEINQVLAEIISKIDAGWATVWQFHNGSMTMIGVPFLKVSATHSQTGIGCPQHAEQFQGLSTSLLGDLSPLLEKPILRLSSDNKEYSAIAYSMKTMCVETMYVLPLFNATNILVGALTVSFKEDVIISDEDIEWLRLCKQRIVVLLDRMSVEKNGYMEGH